MKQGWLKKNEKINVILEEVEDEAEIAEFKEAMESIFVKELEIIKVKWAYRIEKEECEIGIGELIDKLIFLQRKAMF